MKYLNQFSILGLVFFFCSCTDRIPKEVKETLKLAGDNRKELESVIRHYKSQDNRLKLEATYFLIKNMKYHGYFEIENNEKYNALFDSIGKCKPAGVSGDEVFDNTRRGMLIDDLVDDFQLSNPGERYRGQFHSDLQSLDASFLIENIDYAFKAWELPWARRYNFNEFCKYILPYRYGSEAPGRWRKRFYEEFKWITDSLKGNDDVIEVTTIINRIFRNKISYSNNLKRLGNNIKAEHLFDGMVVESCEGQTGLGVCILRAIGIPVTTIVIPWWGNWASGHQMNALLDSTKTWQYFAFDDWDPSVEKKDIAPKVFLSQFDKLPEDKNVYNPFLMDAGPFFQQVKNIQLNNVEYDQDIMLCVFGDRSWTPISKGCKNNFGIVFKNVSMKNDMFISGTFEENRFIPSTYPFTSDSTGYPKYYIPDTSSIFSLTIDRKFPPNAKETRCKALKGGMFQVSNDKNFLSNKTIFKINDPLEYRQNRIGISPEKTKYVRFVFPPNISSCPDGPAEVTFYTSGTTGVKKVRGTYYGSPQLNEKQIKLLTDNDILTYVEWSTYPSLVNSSAGNILIKASPDENIWLGMELDTITKITHVGICPRNDKNDIYPGMYYELLYWDNQWVSLGIKEATGHALTYDNIPSNAVLWLRNHSEGKEERIFTIEDGKQIWW